MSDAAVLLEGAEVRLHGRVLLGPVDLRIEHGEHWAILGPNGGGKTTLLSLIGAWRQPSQGRVAVLGARLGRTDVRALRRRIGHVSHHVADRLRPSMTVMDAVLAGRVFALETWWQDLGGADREAAEAALEQVGCAELAERRIGTMSLGERARVLIARALVGDPELLLFDEPAAGLDLPARERLLQAMRAASRRPGLAASIVTTHHLEEIPVTVSHAALLREGAVVAAGPVDEVLATEPLSACFGMEVVVHRRDDRWWGRAG
ncbi:MAG: ATP-binding cassette domain-containing protein [Actinomycetota bacterium]